jgi:opacity protein-like surface antigen
LYDNNGKSMQAGRAEVGYGYLYQDEFIINVKATYDLTKPVIHTSLDSASRKDTQQSHFSVAVEPGLLIDSKTLVFGRLGIHCNKIHYFRNFISGAHTGETSNATTSYTGYGIGAGIKSELSNHVVIGIDTEIVSYGRKNPYFVRSGGTISDTNSYKLTSNITSITISKKF